VVRGIDQVVTAHTYDLMIFSSNRANHRDDPTWERKVVAQLNGSIVDGIIAVTPTTIELPTNSPIVTVDPCDGGNFPSVLATNHEGTALAVRYLIGLGHRRIGMIGGRSSLLSARQRREGYEEAHRNAGLPLRAELYVEGDYSRGVAFVGAQQLLSLAERPTAIMAANDQTAFAVMEVAGQMNIRIPQELSVIGFDNIPESAYTSPPLTTVDQAIVAMGGRAAELLIQKVEGKEVANDLYQLPTQLIVRESCQQIAS
jgi:LacI family transcriptional regulator